MATPTSKAPARETIPRTTANPYPAPYNTHDPEWIKHYPDSLDQHHAHTNGGESEGFAYSNGEISSAPPPEMSPLEKSDLKADKRCVFCQIVAGKRPCYEVYRDQHCMAFLDLFPLTEGQWVLFKSEECC